MIYHDISSDYIKSNPSTIKEWYLHVLNNKQVQKVNNPLFPLNNCTFLSFNNSIIKTGLPEHKKINFLPVASIDCETVSCSHSAFCFFNHYSSERELAMHLKLQHWGCGAICVQQDIVEL